MNIQNFLLKLQTFISSLFNGLPVRLQDAARIAIQITEAVKNFDDKNPIVADIVTAIIPGDIDDKIKTWLRGQIPIILSALRLVSADKVLVNTDKVTLLAIKNIQQLEGDVKSAFLHDFAVLLSQEIAKAQNGELKWGDAVYIIEWYYQHKYKSI